MTSERYYFLPGVPLQISMILTIHFTRMTAEQDASRGFPAAIVGSYEALMAPPAPSKRSKRSNLPQMEERAVINVGSEWTCIECVTKAGADAYCTVH